MFKWGKESRKRQEHLRTVYGDKPLKKEEVIVKDIKVQRIKKVKITLDEDQIKNCVISSVNLQYPDLKLTVDDICLSPCQISYPGVARGTVAYIDKSVD